MRLQRRAIQPRNTEELTVIAANGRIRQTNASCNRRYSAIIHAVVVHIFIGKAELPIVADSNAEIGVDRKTTAIDERAVAFDAFVRGVDPKRGFIT